MFEEFYGFSGKPFQLTPDPDFYFRSATHRKALSYLGYGLAQGEGFIVITGEIGAGKSTLVAHTMKSLDPGQVTVAQVVTSKLDGEEIVHVIARAFGLDIAGHDKASALGAIEAMLHEEAREGKRCLLVVDEAQNLDVQALEELRMLSNFQLGSHPLLQVLLLGQPEFRATLQNDAGLEQLRQRVIAAHHLEAMHVSEVEPYIMHRLEKVGWQGNPAFEQDAFAAIHQHSGGIPRKVNQLANRLLLLGAVENLSSIDGELVAQVVSELDGDKIDMAGAINKAAQEREMPQVASEEAVEELSAAPVMPVIDPQFVDDLLAERDVQIAELRQAVSELSSRDEEPEEHPEINALREQIAELQQAVVELSNQQEDEVAEVLNPEIEALREQVAKLEARTFEQERTIRQTLSMLIEWIESEMDTNKAA